MYTRVTFLELLAFVGWSAWETCHRPNFEELKVFMILPTILLSLTHNCPHRREHLDHSDTHLGVSRNTVGVVVPETRKMGAAQGPRRGAQSSLLGALPLPCVGVRGTCSSVASHGEVWPLTQSQPEHCQRLPGRLL